MKNNQIWTERPIFFQLTVQLSLASYNCGTQTWNVEDSLSQNKENDFAYLVNDKLIPADAAAMQGFIGNKLDLSYTNRILAQNVDHPGGTF